MLIGGAIFPIVAGCYYFFPLINGKKLSDRLGRIAFWLMFIGFNVTFLPMHLTGLRGMPRRVFTYQAGLGFDALNLVSSHRRIRPRRRALSIVAWDIIRPKKKAAVFRAQSVECRHARMAAGDARASRGACARSRRSTAAIRSGISRISCATWTRAASICPTRRRASARRWSRPSIDAKPVQCLRLPGSDFHHALGRDHARRVLHFRHVSLVVAGAASAPSLAVGVIWRWLWTGTAFIPEKRGEGRRPRPDAAALRLRRGVGRLVGDVHHDARGS